MKRKSRYLICLSLIMTAVILFGCGGNSGSNSNSGNSNSGTSSSESASGDTVAATSEQSEPSGEDNATDSASTDELPIVSEPVTYHLACQLASNWGNPEDGEFWANLEKETNVHIEWTTFLDNEASEKYSLLMASGDYPDGFIGTLGGGTQNILTYGPQGVYIPLNDLIDQYMVHFPTRVHEANPTVMGLITAPDGNIYALPSLLYNPLIYNSTFINRDWLDQLGLDSPTTTDEFADVLRQFKANDLNGNGRNDEIPMSFMFNDWGAADHGPYFGSFGYPLSTDYTIIDQKKVVYLGAADSFRDTAAWLAGLYAEGLIDKEVFTQNDSAYGAKLSPDATLGVFSSWDRATAGDNKDQYELLLPLKGPNGDQNTLRESITGFYRDQFIITTKAENPEILIKWIDQFYRDMTMGLNATMGMGPGPDMAWDYDSSGNIVWNDSPDEKYIRGQQQLPFAPAILGEGVSDILAATGMTKIKQDDTELYMPFAEKYTSGEWERFPNVFTTEEENEELATLKTDLTTYSKNKLASWIAGETDCMADWDSYQQELKKIGIDRWVELSQQVYDRYDAAR